MSELKIGDRVEVAYPKGDDEEELLGEIGKIVCLKEELAGVEFGNCFGGHNCLGYGRYGHCWWIYRTSLEKVENTKEEPKEEIKEEIKEETKADTFEQKILEVLRAEIGVDIGEEFSVCKIGGEHWVCKFEENGFTHKMNGNFCESGLWKSIISDFQSFKFKKKPFIPKKWENYWSFKMRHSPNGNKSLVVKKTIWDGLELDYGMLALGNVFRTKEEALKGKDKLLERLNELLKGE